MSEINEVNKSFIADAIRTNITKIEHVSKSFNKEYSDLSEDEKEETKRCFDKIVSVVEKNDDDPQKAEGFDLFNKMLYASGLVYLSFLISRFYKKGYGVERSELHQEYYLLKALMYMADKSFFKEKFDFEDHRMGEILVYSSYMIGDIGYELGLIYAGRKDLEKQMLIYNKAALLVADNARFYMALGDFFSDENNPYYDAKKGKDAYYLASLSHFTLSPKPSEEELDVKLSSFVHLIELAEKNGDYKEAEKQLGRYKDILNKYMVTIARFWAFYEDKRKELDEIVEGKEAVDEKT